MRFPIYPQHLVAQIRSAMPDDGMICLDNGVYKIWFARNYKAHRSGTVLSITRWPPWAPVCRPLWPLIWFIRIVKSWLYAVMAVMMNSQELEMLSA